LGDVRLLLRKGHVAPAEALLVELRESIAMALT
jgi:hypothetical protein